VIKADQEDNVLLLDLRADRDDITTPSRICIQAIQFGAGDEFNGTKT
jgi:hypothetical protein